MFTDGRSVFQPAAQPYPQVQPQQPTIVQRLENSAAIVQTSPTPSVSQPELSYWRIDVNRFLTGPIEQIAGATNQQTYVFQPNQPDRSQIEKVQQSNRYQVPAIIRVEGAISQQTYIFQPNQPDRSQVENLQQRSRYQVPVIEQFAGATVQGTVPIPGVSQPELSYWKIPSDINKLITGPLPQFSGSTVQGTIPIPGVSQPELNAYSRQQFNRYIIAVKPFLDSVAPIVVQTYLFPPNQPELNGYLATQQNRYQVETIKRFEGSTSQQTYIFAPSQPDRAQIERIINENRYIVEPVKRFEGATAGPQQTYIFPQNQPDRGQVEKVLNENRYVVDITKRFEGATNQQTYVFVPNEPELGSYSNLQRNRFQVDVTKQFVGIAPLSPQTYIFPVSQPTLGLNRQQPLAVYVFGASTIAITQPGLASVSNRFATLATSASSPDGVAVITSKPLGSGKINDV